MTKDDILQLVIETGDNIYNKYDNQTDKAQAQMHSEILNNVEILITEVLYKIQNTDPQYFEK